MRRCAKCNKWVTKDKDGILPMICDNCWGMKPDSIFRKSGPLNKFGVFMSWILLPIFIIVVVLYFLGEL